MRPEKSPGPEFSRPVALEAVGARPQPLRLQANAAERLALAGRLGLVALDLLEAELTLQLDQRRSAIRVRGSFEAAVVQTCVATLEPVPARLAETVDLLYGLGHQDAAGDGEVEVGGEDEIEPIAPEGLDLGEMVAQLLAVALDPYPRSPGADLVQLEWSGPGAAAAPKSPFAALAQLRRDD